MQQAITFTPDDFQRFMAEVKETIRKEVKGYMVEEPLTAKQAAAYLKITEWTMRDRIKKGSLPASLIHRSGGTVYFFASELEQYLKNN